MVREKHRKACKALNYTEHSVILISAITCCVLISPFNSLFGIPIGIESSAVGLKMCAITAAIKKE